MLETLKKSKGYKPFHEKVAAAYTQVFAAHVGKDRAKAERNPGDLITAAMVIKQVVAMFPETAKKKPKEYSPVFRKLGLPPFKKKRRSK